MDNHGINNPRKEVNYDTWYTSNDLLHDYKGNRYEVSEQYAKEVLTSLVKNDTVSYKLAHSIIQDGFKILTQQQSKVMFLLIERGLTEQAVADLLCISQVAVHRLKKRAIKTLKKYIPKMR